MSALDELDKRFEDGTATALDLCVIWGDDAEHAAAELARLRDAYEVTLGLYKNEAEMNANLQVEVSKLRAALDEARKVIEDIRDLARTGLAPVAFGFTEEQWSSWEITSSIKDIFTNAAACLEKYPPKE